MNFVPATVQDGTAKASGFDVKLPEPVNTSNGTIGFRPESITDRVGGLFP